MTTNQQRTLVAFDPANVRTIYDPPGVDVAPADVDQDAELVGLAGLAWALRQAAELPGVILQPAPGIDGGAQTVGSPCVPVPTIQVDPELLAGTTLSVYGTLAHEIAHQALDHPGRLTLRLWWATTRVAAVAGLLALAARTPWQITTAALAVSVGARLMWARGCRLDEYDADTYSVTLLDRTGVPGADAVLAALFAIAHRDTRWYRLFGWIAGTHPTAAARMRVVDRGRRAARLDWRTALTCQATGHRLLTAGHRHAHHAGGDRCRPTWWRLLPLWRSPSF
uniref:M48 family metalloprotease n=1 Tax=Sphaerisporangium sp. CA-236357 TaxID=3240030 RepID=UPI003F494E84